MTDSPLLPANRLLSFHHRAAQRDSPVIPTKHGFHRVHGTSYSSIPSLYLCIAPSPPVSHTHTFSSRLSLPPFQSVGMHHTWNPWSRAWMGAETRGARRSATALLESTRTQHLGQQSSRPILWGQAPCRNHPLERPVGARLIKQNHRSGGDSHLGQHLRHPRDESSRA